MWERVRGGGRERDRERFIDIEIVTERFIDIEIDREREREVRRTDCDGIG